MAAGGNEVTLAVIQRDIFALTEDVKGMRGDMSRLLDDLEKRVRAGELKCASCPPTIKAIQDDLSALKTRATVWDTINTIAAVIAAAVGASFKRP